jgi:hypothetical protein
MAKMALHIATMKTMAAVAVPTNSANAMGSGLVARMVIGPTVRLSLDGLRRTYHGGEQTRRKNDTGPQQTHHERTSARHWFHASQYRGRSAPFARTLRDILRACDATGIVLFKSRDSAL